MDFWDQMVDCISRPPRDSYTIDQLLGSPAGSMFAIGPVLVKRSDFELTNKHGAKLQCSHYCPIGTEAGLLKGKDGKLPVVVYCHCNSGSRRDAEEAVGHLLPMGIGVVAFDFMGSGLSDGQWVTLGYNEADDLGVVIEWLRARGDISAIGLWGRSMGAVTALMYSSRDPQVAGMVLDSPFSRLTDLMSEIVKDTGLPIPKPLFKVVTSMMRRSVKRKAGFDISDVSPLDVVGASVIPAVFGHAIADSFIRISHSEKLVAAYGGEYKNLVRFEGDHNHFRPKFFYDSVTMFFHQQFRMDEQLPGHADYIMNYEIINGGRGVAWRGRRSVGQGTDVGDVAATGAEAGGFDRANGIVNEPWRIGMLSDEAFNDLSEEQIERLLNAASAAPITAAASEAAAAAAAAAAADGGIPTSHELAAVTLSGVSGGTGSGGGSGVAVGGGTAAAAAIGGAALDPTTQLKGVLGGVAGAQQQQQQQQLQLPRQRRRQQAVWYDDEAQLQQAMLLSLQEAQQQQQQQQQGGSVGGTPSTSTPPCPIPAAKGAATTGAGAAAAAGAGAPVTAGSTGSGSARSSPGGDSSRGEQLASRRAGGNGGSSSSLGAFAARAKALFGGSGGVAGRGRLGSSKLRDVGPAEGVSQGAGGGEVAKGEGSAAAAGFDGAGAGTSVAGAAVGAAGAAAAYGGSAGSGTPPLAAAAAAAAAEGVADAAAAGWVAGGEGGLAGGGGGLQAGRGVEGEPWRRMAPSSAEEEEELLRRALALSLQETEGAGA